MKGPRSDRVCADDLLEQASDSAGRLAKPAARTDSMEKFGRPCRVMIPYFPAGFPAKPIKVIQWIWTNSKH
jgi:hypothetical protein